MYKWSGSHPRQMGALFACLLTSLLTSPVALSGGPLGRWKGDVASLPLLEHSTRALVKLVRLS